MSEKTSRKKPFEILNAIIDLGMGCFLGYGINIFFNFQILIEAPVKEQQFAQFLLVVAFMLIAIKLLVIRNLRKTLRPILLGVFFISTIFAIYSFSENVEWFSKGGYATIPNIYVMDLEGNQRPLTIYPPELIFNLMKSVFVSSVSSFAERLIKK